jgi:hypothetical protein
MGALPAWGWAGVAALPPLLLGLFRWRRRRHVPVVPTRRRSDDPELALDRALVSVVARSDIATAERLVPALRAAGMNEDEASAIATLRDRVQRHRYGPPAGEGAPDRAAVDRAVGQLRGLAASRPLRLGLLLLLAGGPMSAQGAPPAESLYAGGALRRAAAGFEAALQASPRDPALWYNLGAARYRLGEDGGAAAAWLTALRLAPREATVRRALLLAPAPDQVSAGRRGVPPVSAAEMALLTLASWCGAWALLMVRERAGRWSRAIPVLFLVSVLAGGGALLTGWWNRRPLALVTTDVPLRVAPHERAAGSRNLPAGTAVLLERHQPGWYLVRAGNEERGWVQDVLVAGVGR